MRELTAMKNNTVTQELPAPLDEVSMASPWKSLLRQCEAVHREWVRNGLLVSSVTLAKAWGRSRQALDQAAKRGEIFYIKVGKNKHYPEVFVHLGAHEVKTVCLQLKGEDGGAKFVIWNQIHSVLGGITISEAIAAGQVAKVTHLAEAWSVERGLI